MIGYLIFDSSYIDKIIANELISKLKTFELIKHVSIGGTEICFIQNEHENNYLVEDERYIICATGTFIYNGARGNEAIQLLLQKLDQKSSLEDLMERVKNEFPDAPQWF